MAENWFDTPEKLELAQHRWREYSISDEYLKLQDVIDSLSSADKLVEARQVYASRWILSLKDVATPKDAIFHTVGVYRWGTHAETGNYVPRGAKAPASVAESRLRSVPSTLCQFSHAFDTHTDKTLWKAQKAFEEYVAKVDGYNTGLKPRREWQDGSKADHPNSYFVFNSQIFIKRNGLTKHREAHISYDLHSWIEAVQSAPKSEFFANPDRPQLFDAQGGELCDIKESSPPYLRKGDLVWISFSVEFILGGDTWVTTFVPYDLIRVGSVSPDLVGDTVSSTPEIRPEDLAPRPRLKAGMKLTASGDVPTPNIGPPIPVAAAGLPASVDVQAMEVESDAVNFGPADVRSHGWDNWRDDRRSATPLTTWEGTPPPDVEDPLPSTRYTSTEPSGDVENAPGGAEVDTERKVDEAEDPPVVTVEALPVSPARSMQSRGKGKKRAVDPLLAEDTGARRSSSRVARRRVGN